MSSSGFTNTFILEANRLSSEEVKSGNDTNPAIFTNKVNDGLQLNTGDVVGVHSAYISELGAEGSDIEIKGINLDTINASQILKYNEIRNDAFEGSIANTNFLRKVSIIYNGFPLTRREPVNERIQYRDDEINMVMNPYKNANGEYYIGLPWRYGMETAISDHEQIYLWNRGNPIIGLSNELQGSASRTFGNASHGCITRMPPHTTFNVRDFRLYRPNGIRFGGALTVPNNNGSETYAIRHDNSRYAVYQLRNCIHMAPLQDNNSEFTNVRHNCLAGILWKYDSETNTSTSLGNASYINGVTADEKYGNKYWNDIATREYVRVLNKVNCSVTAGYNSNTDIATKITESMLRTDEISDIEFNLDVVSQKATNSVNKLYNVATLRNYNEYNWGQFNHVGTLSSQDDAKFNYIEAHETIGVKRPDLYDLGREFSTKSEGYETELDYYYDNSGFLFTNIPWSKVQDLKNLVDAQHRYPELFDAYEMAGGKSNLTSTLNLGFRNNEGLGKVGFLHYNQNASHKFLGYDLVDNNASYWGNTITEMADHQTCPNASFCSQPFFFQINESTKDTPEGINATGQSFEDAVYGFAIKRVDNGVETISLKVSGLWNNGIYYDNGLNLFYMPEGTKIGWDYHWLAYGCPCMLLWNGFCGEEGLAYNGQGKAFYVDADEESVNSTKKVPEVIRELYIGSPEAQMNFDSQADRFEFLRLHKSEVLGNLWNAGFTAGAPVNTQFVRDAVPENPNADVKAYKLYKKLRRNNFTPSMAPYENENFGLASQDWRQYDTAGGNACNTDYLQFLSQEYPNNNFDRSAIFDSECGNYIVDWGMNEKYWNDSLWGIMGFRYSQTSGSGNSQTRVTNSINWGDSSKIMDENTTNADITNADWDQLTRNQYNSKMYGLTPPYAVSPLWFPFLVNGNDTTPYNASHTYQGTLTVTQDKGQPLRAKEIPTRTLRPYYTIRSNITGKSNFYGGGKTGVPLPVVAVVEKVSQSGDFFNLSQSRLNFTITQPTTLTDITTSIHDPDGSYAKLSPNSAVLYSVSKQQTADMNVVSTILQGDNKKQAQEFEEELAPQSPTKKDITDVINQMKV